MTFKPIHIVVMAIAFMYFTMLTLVGIFIGIDAFGVGILLGLVMGMIMLPVMLAVMD